MTKQRLLRFFSLCALIFFLSAQVASYGQNIYDSLGNISGKYVDKRFFDAKGNLLGYMIDDHLFDCSGKLMAGIKDNKLYSPSSGFLGKIDDPLIYRADGRKKGIIAHQTIFNNKGIPIGSYENLANSEVKLFYMLSK